MANLPPLLEGCFYQISATFYPDLEFPSPLVSNQGAISSPLPPMTALRVSSQTSAWWGDIKEKNGRRFVKLGGTPSPSEVCLEVVPGPNFFSETTYLNFTHPLRVCLHQIMGQSLNQLRLSPGLLPSTPPPPTVGIRSYVAPSIPRLTAESMILFWGLHARYHRDRSYGGGGGGGGHGHGNGGGGDGSGCGDGGGGDLQSSRGVKRSSSDMLQRSGVHGPPTSEAPWGTLGPWRIGVQIPVSTENTVDEYISDSEDEDRDSILGDLFIWDIDRSQSPECGECESSDCDSDHVVHDMVKELRRLRDSDE